MTTTDQTTIERVADRVDVWSAYEMTDGADAPTDQMRDRLRDHDKIPAWAEPHYENILRTTIDVYAGIRKTPTRAHVFVIGGVRFDGVYDVADAWLYEVGSGFRDDVLDRDLAHSTVATMIGAVCEAILGGRIYDRYYREGSADNEQGDMFDVETHDGDPGDDTEGFVPLDVDEATGGDDFDAGPPRVSIRCPSCNRDHGRWSIERSAGGTALIAECGPCGAQLAFQYAAFRSDPDGVWRGGDANRDEVIGS